MGSERVTAEQRAREVLAQALERNDQFTSASAVRREELSGWMVPTHVVTAAMLAFAAEAREECARVAEQWSCFERSGAARAIAAAIRRAGEG